MSISAGTRFGPYEVLSPLGAGGMGEVYRARDTKLNRNVAIKVLPVAFAADAERLARFAHEAQMLAALNHPNIAHIHGLEDSSGTPALVMELVEGQTLSEILVGSGPLAPETGAGIVRQIAEALEAAHARGIVHRDLKPANIKVTTSGLVKVLDFGLAKELRPAEDLNSAAMTAAGRPPVTAVGSVVGTLAYMSPEQARGERVDARSDLFSLGVILYEVTTGQRPFDAPVSTLVVDAILHKMPLAPRSVNNRIPDELERIILHLLEKNISSRYQKASDVVVDLKRLDLEWTTGLDAPRSARVRRRIVAAGVAVIAAAGIAAWIWPRGGAALPASAGRYEQVTFFANSATAPSLSADGRLLTFIQGSDPFFTPGQIYVKALPDGDPVQLTRDNLRKMAPVFSPDGSRIAYTTVEPPSRWDTWTVPVLGGEAQLWLKNTATLNWLRDKRVMFSEVIQGTHMRVVTGDESRHDLRPVYTPAQDVGMAHWSYPSPDGRSVAIVEMQKGVWMSCRVVPVDGSSEGRKVGGDGQCVSAAWSPDGRWLYFSSNVAGGFHIWREPASGGRSEQVTQGPTEEQGIAIAPDGRSLLTSIGNRQRELWIHDEQGEHAVSREGYAFIPQPPSSLVQPFSADGRKVFYLVRRGSGRLTGATDRDGELWMTDIATGRSESIAPGFDVVAYDVSRDVTRVVFAALDAKNAPHLWLARLDRQLPPRQLSSLEADNPRFGANGDVFCRTAESASGKAFVYRVPPDGSEPRRAIDTPIQWFLSASADGTWLIATIGAEAGGLSNVMAFPTSSGGPPVRVCTRCHADWTSDGKALVLRLESGSLTRTVVLALEPGRMLPELPADGVTFENLPHLSPLSSNDLWVHPLGTTRQYLFSRDTIQRNIYRVPL